MSGYLVRTAVPEDSGQIANVHHRTWQHAYGALLPASHWDSDTVASRIARWQRRLARQDPVGWPQVALIGGTVVGFAQSGPARVKNGLEPVYDREVWSLYVLPEQHGTGVGAALLEAVLPGSAAAVLWVADPNPRAQAFYAKHGFVLDTESRFTDQHGIDEVRMLRGAAAGDC